MFEELSAGTLVGCDDESLLSETAVPSATAHDGNADVLRTLSIALERASAAGEWSTVAVLASELAARRVH